MNIGKESEAIYVEPLEAPVTEEVESAETEETAVPVPVASEPRTVGTAA